ncbi:hypothetical protein [Sphingomicrobium flavum]|uniref:hypothetical protein n=1 Tax=Sphingomicrobium flavum TaxID=1229164 RepID=UPI0021ADB3E0|nr:hypothetical protein [Sphingomicrobium flavum]
MTQTELTGEARLRSKTRRKWIITGALMVVGGVVGFTAARMEDIRNYDAAGPWPPEVALGILAAFLISLAVGTYFLNRELDDYEREVHRKSAAFAAGVVMIGYPVWFLLWKASLVVEPIHWVIFISAYVGLYLAMAYYKYR